MSDQTTHRAVLISSMDLALMEAERKRLRKERDAATNALHGMRRRLDRLKRTLANTREVLESTDEWQQGLLEDHWDAVSQDELEQDDD